MAPRRKVFVWVAVEDPQDSDLERGCSHRPRETENKGWEVPGCTVKLVTV